MNKSFLALRTVALTTIFALLFSSSVVAQQGRDLQLSQTASQGDGKRTALVIGNGTYTSSPLKNPPNDATDMAKALSNVGFTVEHGVDLTQRQMKAMIREFGQKLKAGGQGLFYFAGHGIQLRGRNYLIPVDAEITSEADVEDQGVDANLIMGLMDEAGNGLNVVILDACRNNPFARSFRSAGNGLAQVEAPTGTLVAYATAPGKVARDGTGRNGAYTAELLKQMNVPGLPIEEVMKRVRANLKQLTNGEQIPWESSSLVGNFYLNKAAGASNAANNPVSEATGAATAANPAAVEQEYWETIKESRDVEDFRDYLKEYPAGPHAVIARSNLRRLEAAGKTSSDGTGNAGGVSGASNTAGGAKPGAVVRSQMGMELVYVPAGSFTMGAENSGDEKPVHQVTIRDGFYMGKYEVTQAQWQAVMGDNPSKFKGDNLPVETISWIDAQNFIQKLNALNDGFIYRLPTEAEWEYAARAGTTGDYAGSLDTMAWYGNNAGRQYIDAAEIWRTDKSNYVKRITDNGNQTHAVGTKQPNAFGLYDMHGNVWEWCQDWYHENYNGAPGDGSAWESGGEQKYRVLRGGSWYLYATYCRSAFRLDLTPDNRNDSDGLRVVAVART